MPSSAAQVSYGSTLSHLLAMGWWLFRIVAMLLQSTGSACFSPPRTASLFVIGSKLHDATIAEVLDIHFKEFIDVDVTKIKWDPRSGPSAFWTAFPSMRTTANGQRGQPVPEGDAPLGVRTLI